MMGSADQLMDMSLDRPYGGQNRLADRLLAIKDFSEAHRKIVKDLATTVFRKDRLLADARRSRAAPIAILEREAAARAERAEPPVGFGPPGALRPPTCGRSPRSDPSRSPISSPGRRTATGRSSTSGLRAAVPRRSRSMTRRSARL